ncbi:MAG: co-chaperone GroES [Gammaproteobacteria bacterium]|nr:co-chaperone GroES [Gammaproteobacteria bacterium]
MYISDEDVNAAKELIANGEAVPVGYRVMVRSIHVDTNLDSYSKSEFPTLGEIEFQDKTDDEAVRQSVGTYFGLVVDVGDFAYGGGRLGDKPWVEKSDVAIFERYAGVRVDFNGDEYRFMNDENILGKIMPKSEVENVK